MSRVHHFTSKRLPVGKRVTLAGSRQLVMAKKGNKKMPKSKLPELLQNEQTYFSEGRLMPDKENFSKFLIEGDVFLPENRNYRLRFALRANAEDESTKNDSIPAKHKDCIVSEHDADDDDMVERDKCIENETSKTEKEDISESCESNESARHSSRTTPNEASETEILCEITTVQNCPTVVNRKKQQAVEIHTPTDSLQTDRDTSLSGNVIKTSGSNVELSKTECSLLETPSKTSLEAPSKTKSDLATRTSPIESNPTDEAAKTDCSLTSTDKISLQMKGHDNRVAEPEADDDDGVAECETWLGNESSMIEKDDISISFNRENERARRISCPDDNNDEFKAEKLGKISDEQNEQRQFGPPIVIKSSKRTVSIMNFKERYEKFSAPRNTHVKVLILVFFSISTLMFVNVVIAMVKAYLGFDDCNSANTMCRRFGMACFSRCGMTRWDVFLVRVFGE